MRFADHVYVPHGKGHRGRAHRYGVAFEKIEPEDIYRRDRWRCALCTKRVDKQLEWPHPMSASLDHTVPMSRGGDHVAANVQLAHLRCNILKGASADARAAADPERAQAPAR